MQRYGRVIRLRSDSAEEYDRLHAAVPAEVLQTIADCNMRNYSIFRWERTLFAYFEYVGQDFAGDMARMAADPATQRWWERTEPLQEPLLEREPNEWWLTIPEVFHVG